MIYLELIVGGNQVDGDGTAPDYSGQIEIESFDWKLKAEPIYEPNGKDMRTQVTPRHISLSKYVDPATPNLCKFMDAKTQFSTATLTMLTMAWAEKATTHQKVMQLVLADGYVEDVNIQASESGKAVALKEKVTLSYRTSKLLYYPFDPERRARGNKATSYLCKDRSKR